ncbi:MAG: zf-HC2 domain-containing protein [Gemmatimonadota bacterium]
MCKEFLQRYSEYLDERLSARDLAAVEAHLQSCEACCRYDRVVRRGLSVWRSLPHIGSSRDFGPRLRHRLYHIDDERHLSHHYRVGGAALVAVAAVGLLALAWLPFALEMSVEVELPAVAVEVPSSFPARAAAGASLFGRGPFVVPAANYHASPERSSGELADELFGEQAAGEAAGAASASEPTR